MKKTAAEVFEEECLKSGYRVIHVLPADMTSPRKRRAKTASRNGRARSPRREKPRG